MTRVASNRRDISNQVFGNLTAIKVHEVSKWGHTMWLCKCSCGTETVVQISDLTLKRTLSCGCINDPNKELGPYKLIRNQYVKSCNFKNREWALSNQEFLSLVTTNCFYCGAEPTARSLGGGRKGQKKRTVNANGIDRINNSKGYTMENCLPCCRTCNVAKSTHTTEEFIAWANRLTNHLKLMEEITAHGGATL